MTTPKRPTGRKLIEAARAIFEREGEIEIDDNAKISRARGENGAYVQAWVWVYDEDVTRNAAAQ